MVERGRKGVSSPRNYLNSGPDMEMHGICIDFGLRIEASSLTEKRWG